MVASVTAAPAASAASVVRIMIPFMLRAGWQPGKPHRCQYRAAGPGRAPGLIARVEPAADRVPAPVPVIIPGTLWLGCF